jgi:hypothetical protein
MSTKIIDFDHIDDWEDDLTAVLAPHIPPYVRREVTAAKPAYEYVDDARDLLLKLTPRNVVIDATLDWIRSSHLAAYHGTRLNDAEVKSVRINGLIPLKAENRRERLTRALSLHPEWHSVADRLEEAIQQIGPKNRNGKREGQVHLTLSKAGLTNGFNHYIKEGSEFDWHVAHRLFGEEGQRLISLDGKPKVVRVSVPGSIALEAAHPFFDVEYIKSNGEIPNIVKEFLMVWSYRLAHPTFQPHSLKVDCGLMFRSSVPAEWIVEIETLPE